MIAYRVATGILFVILGALVLGQMLVFAVHDGTRVIVGAILGLAMIGLGGHRIVLVLRARGAR